MAEVYRFDECRSLRLSRDISQQTEDVVDQLRDLKEQFNRLRAGCDRAQETGQMFYSQLEAHLLTLKMSREFGRRCSTACELKSIEKMVEKRNQLIECRSKHL